MGTNYYTPKDPPCPTCNKGGEDYHIGKSSGGWQFLFASYPEKGLVSCKDWREFLKGRKIIDEYGKEYTYEQLFEWVENKQGGRNLEIDGYPDWRRFEYTDPEGYRISTHADFS